MWTEMLQLLESISECEGVGRVQLLKNRGVGCNKLETTKVLVFKFTKDGKKINCYSQCYLTKTSVN